MSMILSGREAVWAAFIISNVERKRSKGVGREEDEGGIGRRGEWEPPTPRLRWPKEGEKTDS